MSERNNGGAGAPGASRPWRELRPWRGPQRRGPEAARWLAWFDGHVRRLRRMLERHRQPEMVLARSVVWVQRKHATWMAQTFSLRPQIHLAIQPVLRETIWRQTSQLAFASPAPGNELSPSDVTAFSGTAAPTFPESPPRLHHLSTARADAVARHRRGWGLPRPGSFSAALALPPLALVLKRAEPGCGFLNRPPQSQVLTSQSSVLLNRVVRKTQRLEESIQKPLLVEARPQPKTELIHAKRAHGASEFAEAVETVSGRTRWPQPAPQPPPVNVEALADQVLQRIDRRVTAWRERNGRR